MKIEPLSGIVHLKINEAKAGMLDTSSRSSAIEFAEVLEVGPNVSDLPNGYNIKKGDKIFVKAWAIDIITHEGETYYFTNIETKGILAKIDD